jgi:hypothetical protein
MNSRSGLVKQKAKELYVASAVSSADRPVGVLAAPANKLHKKRSMSLEGREAIRKAQKARWAPAKKAKS